MKLKQIGSFLLTVAMVVSLCAGCGESDKPYVPTGNALEMDDGNAVTAPTQEEEKPQELTLVYHADNTMNPILSTDFTNRALFSLLYQGLFVLNRNYQVEPVLCKQYQVSSDMMVYTFYLEDATYSDGAPVTDADVVASLLAAKESDYYKGRFTHISKIELAEGGGVTVTLNTPYENLPMLLDIPIIKASQLESDMPLGTGPYVLEHGIGGARLRQRSSWWCKADLVVTATGIPLIDGGNAAQIRDEFQFGQLDLVCANPASDSYADYRCDFELWDCENGLFLYVGCNMTSPIFSNDTIRSALTYAIDRESLVKTYYKGFGRTATLPASPLFPYYNTTLAEKYQYDGVKFIEALESSGITDREVTLLVNKDDSLRLRVARAIGEMLEECGLEVTMKEVDTAEYKECLLYRTFDLYVGQTKLSPNMDLSPFFYTWGELSNGAMNDSGLYTLCLQALANSGNYSNLHRQVMEDGRLCPVLFCGYSVYATRGLLTDLTPSRDNVFYYSLGKTMKDALIES